MATIKDVAKRAGVSITAVSRALNNYPDINADTKAKILKVVEELRYYPRASARNLVTQRTYTIGVFYPNYDGTGLRQPFIAHVLDVFKNCVGEYGYDIMIFSSTVTPFDRFDVVDRVRHRDVDGVLLLGAPDESIKRLADANVPLVGVDHTSQARKSGSISSDNRRAMHDLICILYNSGYRKIAYAHGPLDLPVSVERLQGFYSGMDAVGLEPNPEYIVNGTFNFDGGVIAGETLLQCRVRPEIIVCASDPTAIGVMQACHKAGVSIPDEISVTGFDDIDAAMYMYPQLTTIHQDIVGMGRKAAHMMMQLIERDDVEYSVPMHYTIPTSLVVRETTRPLLVLGETPARSIAEIV